MTNSACLNRRFKHYFHNLDQFLDDKYLFHVNYYDNYEHPLPVEINRRSWLDIRTTVQIFYIKSIEPCMRAFAEKH